MFGCCIDAAEFSISGAGHAIHSRDFGLSTIDRSGAFSMNDSTIHNDECISYEAPQILATFAAHEVLAEAETSSVIIIIH